MTNWLFIILSRPRIIELSDVYIRHRVLSIIQLRQEGRCYQCGAEISDTESIVSCGRRKSYYHKNCAQKLSIIWERKTNVSLTSSVQAPLTAFTVSKEPPIIATMLIAMIVVLLTSKYNVFLPIKSLPIVRTKLIIFKIAGCYNPEVGYRNIYYIIQVVGRVCSPINLILEAHWLAGWTLDWFCYNLIFRFKVLS